MDAHAHIHPDWLSIAGSIVTICLALTDVAHIVAIMVGISTIAYNVIRTIKEFRSKQ